MLSFANVTQHKALFVLVIIPALLLAGCFRPMLADPGNGLLGLKDRLASIAIDPVEDRVGLQVRSKLSFDLTGGAEPPTTRYTLTLATSILSNSALLSGLSEAPEIDMVTLTVDYMLKDASTGKVLDKAKMNTRASYATTLQRFANQQALISAEDSAAEVMADQLRLRLATWLADHP